MQWHSLNTHAITASKSCDQAVRSRVNCNTKGARPDPKPSVPTQLRMQRAWADTFWLQHSEYVAPGHWAESKAGAAAAPLPHLGRAGGRLEIVMSI